jgi:hypothetical protein
MAKIVSDDNPHTIGIEMPMELVVPYLDETYGVFFGTHDYGLILEMRVEARMPYVPRCSVQVYIWGIPCMRISCSVEEIDAIMRAYEQAPMKREERKTALQRGGLHRKQCRVRGPG